ncbi:unnamed protein product [Bursaphelenchus okinawaensis]|uniref:Uncharacterized protein n=1 Tax=Bursaphelenchus okinawaensis TaxID=465554 RepID=A0A811JT52_9BILA|nr:unnamed protein product [Bursaphelenchus okinawaensis]CAG9081834.1 unnamed protein product [Bursaphelenchus okinawaensis]
MSGCRYIDDIHMEINAQFLPVPAIHLTDYQIPDLTNYNFDFRKAKDVLSPEKEQQVGSVSDVEVKPKVEIPASSPIQIATPNPLPSEKKAESANVKSEDSTSRIHHLEEFENKHNVFDQMELMTIDDKIALAELLSSSRVT